MAMVSAIQGAQKDNVRSFNDYMLRVLEVSIVTTYQLFLLYFHVTFICRIFFLQSI